MNWLNDASTSNRLRQTYVSGFMDVSGGNVIVRNGDLLAYGNIVLGGDTSIINIIGTASFERAPIMDGANIIAGTIPPSAIGTGSGGSGGSGGSTSFGFMDLGSNQTIAGNKIFTGDISFNGNTNIGRDASGIVRINGTTTFARNPVITGNGFVVDTSSNQTIIGIKSFIGDASLTGNVILGNTIRRVAIDGNTTMARGVTLLTDMSMTNATGLLSLNGNVSLINSNRILRVDGTSNLNGNVNVGRELIVTGNTRVDSSLSVVGTTTANGNVFINGRRTDISGNLKVSGNSEIGRSGLSENLIYGNTNIRYLSGNTDGIEVADGEIYLKGGEAHFGVLTDAEESQFISDSAAVEPGFRILSNAGSSVQWTMKRNSTGKLYVQNTSGWGVYMDNNSVAWSSECDQSLMYDATTLSGSLDKILALNPISYKLLNDLEARTQLGFKAQEVEQVIPALVNIAPYNEELDLQEGRDPRGIIPTYMIPHLVKSVQELRNNVVVDVSSNQSIRGIKSFVNTLVGSDASMSGNIDLNGNITIKYKADQGNQERGITFKWTDGVTNIGRLYVDPSGPFVLSTDDKMHIVAPEYCIVDSSLLIVNGNIVMKNRQIIQAENNLGVRENVFWPRENDNRTYLNYGANGFNIRNNNNASTMFMENDGRVGIGTVTPTSGYKLDVSGNANLSGYIESTGLLLKDLVQSPTAYLQLVTENGNCFIQSFKQNFVSGSNAPIYFTSKYAEDTYLSIVPETDGNTARVGINRGGIPTYNLDVNGTVGIASQNSPSAGTSVSLKIDGPSTFLGMAVNIGAGNYNSLCQAGDSFIFSSAGGGTGSPLVIGTHNGSGLRFTGNDSAGTNAVRVRGNLNLNEAGGGSINCKMVILDRSNAIAGRTADGVAENCLEPRASDDATYFTHGAGGLYIRTNGTGSGVNGTNTMFMDNNEVNIYKLTKLTKSLELNGTTGVDRQITASYLNLSEINNVNSTQFQLYSNSTESVMAAFKDMKLYSSSNNGSSFSNNIHLTASKTYFYTGTEFQVPDTVYTNIENESGFQLKSGSNYLYTGVSDGNNYSYIQASKSGVGATGLILNGRGGMVGISTFPDTNYNVSIGGTTKINGDTTIDGNLKLRATTDKIEFVYNGTSTTSSIYDNGPLTLEADDEVYLNAPTTTIGGNITMENGKVLKAKDITGTIQNVFWPRETDDGTYLNYGTSGLYIRNNDSQDAIYINNSRNIGIGTTTPGYKLDVFGNAKISTDLYVSGKMGIAKTSVALGFVLDIAGNTNITGNIQIDTSGNGITFPDGKRQTSAFTGGPAGTYTNPSITIDSNGKISSISSGSAGGSINMDNGTTISAKNSSGTLEYFLWPRWTDNASYLNYGSAGFYIRNNSSTSTMFMNNSNQVCINTTTPAASYSLTVNGNIQATSYNATSDYRLKTNIEPLESQLNTIRSLEPKSFVWKKDGRGDVGFLAQEVFNKYPHMRIGDTVGDEPVDASGNPIYLAVDYSKLTPFLWKGIQELIVKVETQDKIIEQQSEEIERQNDKFEKLFEEIEELKRKMREIIL